MFSLKIRSIGVATVLMLGSPHVSWGESAPVAGPIPWDVAMLGGVPKMEWHNSSETVRSLFYAAEPYQGKPTRVFAYYASPATLGMESDKTKKFPGIVLVHGGGGTAFAKWTEIYAKRGYAAIAMDLGGKWLPQQSDQPEKAAVRLPDGGPAADDQTKFAPTEPPHRDQWTYHAVADVILAHSLLRSFSEVDADRVGLTGISWGGYLTCIVAGVDSRFKAAVPQYGCGFLRDNSVWKTSWFEPPKFGQEWAEEWIKLWDPASYVGLAKMPILFINGAQDFAYPLDSYAKTYALVRSAKNISVQPKLGHGHMFEVKEVHQFLDSRLKGAPGLARVSAVKIVGQQVTAAVEDSPKPKYANLQYTTGPHSENRTRPWISSSMEINGTVIAGQAPPAAATAWYISVEDEHGSLVSSELQIKE